MGLVWQPSLLDETALGFDQTFARAQRHDLGSGAWLEVAPGWVSGPASLFEATLAAAPWAEHERHMYDRVVREPRMTTRQWTDPLPILVKMADLLGARYGTDLSTISANLYRDGQDSVAWHGDRVGRGRDTTVVALIALGTPRRFLLRPVTGGRSLRLTPSPGDLVVLGGTAQRTWQHSVPKTKQPVGPRISVMFREAY